VTSLSSSSLAAGPPSARLPLILRQLNRTYGRPSNARGGSPLDSLIGTILSQNTTDVNSGRAFAQLKSRFPNWEAALQARASRIAGAIRSGGLADIKSRRIKRILREIRRDRGRLDLAFLRRMPIPQARDYLTALPGVGPKTAACVLLFSLHKPVFPVDTHVLRVSKRLGLIPPNTTMERAHEIYALLLDSDGAGQWDYNSVLALHLGLVRHGRQTCIARRPRCDACSLFAACPRLDVAARSPARKARE
jgi:endonuclease-3